MPITNSAPKAFQLYTYLSLIVWYYCNQGNVKRMSYGTVYWLSQWEWWLGQWRLMEPFSWSDHFHFLKLQFPHQDHLKHCSLRLFIENRNGLPSQTTQDDLPIIRRLCFDPSLGERFKTISCPHFSKTNPLYFCFKFVSICKNVFLFQECSLYLSKIVFLFPVCSLFF